MRTLLKLAALTGLAACLASCGHSTKNSTDKNASPTDSKNPTTTQITTDNSSALTDCQTKLQNIKTAKECTSTFTKLMSDNPPYCDPSQPSCLQSVSVFLHGIFQKEKALEPTCQTAANSGDTTSALDYAFLLQNGAVGMFDLSVDQIKKILKGDANPPAWKFDKNASMYAVQSIIPACTMKSQCNDKHTSSQDKIMAYLLTNRPKQGYELTDNFYHAIEVCFGPKTDEAIHKLQEGVTPEHTFEQYIDLDTTIFHKQPE